MPLCPGCERAVPHDQLDTHVQHCTRLHGGHPDTMSTIEDLDRRIATVERCLQLRSDRLERELDSPLSSRLRTRTPNSKTNQ